ncbi:MAG: hypothetical protein MJE77_39550 [Proteobacteria bacterium]|nr:hypothetical protein [Pseudomonadota bacterium]
MQFLERGVTLQEFYFQLSGAVAGELSRYLDPIAARWGRTIERLHLSTTEEYPGIEKAIEGVTISRKLPGYDGEVAFKCSFLLQLVDARRYVAIGPLDLDDWAYTAITNVVSKEFFATS